MDALRTVSPQSIHCDLRGPNLCLRRYADSLPEQLRQRRYFEGLLHSEQLYMGVSLRALHNRGVGRAVRQAVRAVYKVTLAHTVIISFIDRYGSIILNQPTETGR